ncbi:MAG TPA: amidohydrolase family protein, partial [Gammaproteobacteria bacterium]|nr:amidohydrolase family protein [Gammaproteobacteria bacterium]
DPRELIDYLRGHGSGKVLFGSNYPMLTPAACLEGLDALELSPETRDAFLSANARRVFGLGT